MKFGAFIFPTDYSIDPAELAREVEARGFESLWFPEHTHIPVSRRTPYPGGAELPEEYSHSLDPFVALGAAAAVTERLKLGTGITLVIERDPITLAKEVATLDHISNGRVLFGVGGGWNREEMANHGTDPSRRWKLLRERIEAMKAIWTQDEAEYHGEFVDFDPIWSWPKPVQRPPPDPSGQRRGRRAAPRGALRGRVDANRRARADSATDGRTEDDGRRRRPRSDPGDRLRHGPDPRSDRGADRPRHPPRRHAAAVGDC